VLITENYRKLNEQLHGVSNYGANSRPKVYTDISRFMAQNKFETLLDYGCGKGELGKHLSAVSYDPCVPEFTERPNAHFDLVACCDVLEHVEPELLDNVLRDIKSYAKRGIYFIISTKLAKKRLADGRNAHLIVKNKDWWLARLRQTFPEWELTAKDSNISEITVYGVQHGSR
jgi:2-polyprenyl-3-methyl-5-hydroxy-6-metoxy-1,4-benzoquinol methylase